MPISNILSQVGQGILGGGATGAAIGGLPGAAIGAGLGALTNIASGIANQPARPRHRHRHRAPATSGATPATPMGVTPVPSQPGQPTGDILSGYNYPGYSQQLPRFSPIQEAALHLLLQQGLSASPEALTQKARTQFFQQTVPTLAERFTSMGAGAQSSPAFAQQLGQAGANLEEGLAALRAQYGLAQLGLGLSPLFENIYIPGYQTQGIGAPLAAGLGQAAASSIPSYLQVLQDFFKNRPQTPITPATSTPISSSSAPTTTPFTPPVTMPNIWQQTSATTPQAFANLYPQQQILNPIQNRPKPNIWQLTQQASNPSSLGQLLA